jgi:hypothetical protein
VKTRNSMKGAIMSRMLMALGVVAALGLFSTEVTAAALPPVPSPAPNDPQIVVPGNVCHEVFVPAPGLIQYSSFSNSVWAAGFTDLVCPLPRPVSNSGVATVTVLGSAFIAPWATCYVLSINGAGGLFTSVISNQNPASVQVNADSSLSVQCSTFGPPATIDAIKVNT